MPSYRFLDFELSEAEFCLSRSGQRIALEPKALRVLMLLVKRAGHLVDKQELLECVWPNSFVEENTLTRTIAILRRELGDSSRDSKIIETVPTRGYRLIAPVTPLEEENRTVTPNSEALTVPTNGQNIASEPTGPSQPPKLRLVDEQQDQTAGKVPVAEIVRGQRNWHAGKWLLVGAVSLLVLVGVATYMLTRSRSADAKAPKITSLAVLPMKNLSGDPAQEYFADGMTEEVIGRLSTIRGLRVISRTSVMQFKDTRLSAPEIARKLGVDALVEGSVIRDGNRIRVHAQLIRGSTDEHFWSESYDRELGDALTLESDVAQSIARKVEVTVTGEERARLVAARPVSPEVYEIYLKGLAAKADRKADVEKRIAYFDEAIRKDPTFAPAYVGLSGAYDGLGSIFVGASPPNETRPRVISAAQKALELDTDLPDAHVLLADTYMSQWRWAEAEAEFKRALDLNPNNVDAHFGLADWLLCHEQVEEALAWARRGRELDPLGESGHSIAWILFTARRYDEAIHEFRNELAVKPDNGNMLWDLGWALIFNGQAREAIPVLEKAVSVTNRSPGIISALIWAYSRDGRRADALRLLGELKKREQAGYVPAAAFVNAYLGLGDNDEAFVWFERAFQEQSNLLKFIKVFPPFDVVRSDPRFQDLVRRVGLN